MQTQMNAVELSAAELDLVAGGMTPEEARAAGRAFADALQAAWDAIWN